MKRTILTTLAVAAAFGLSACGVDEPSPTKTVDDQWVQDQVEDAQKADAEPAEKAADFGDTAKLGEGVTVRITINQRDTTSELDYPSNTEVVKYTVKIVNNGKARVDMSEVYPVCTFGKQGNQSEDVVMDDLASGDTHYVMPGAEGVEKRGCEFPKDENSLQVAVSLLTSEQEAIFTGNVA